MSSHHMSDDFIVPIVYQIPEQWDLSLLALNYLFPYTSDLVIMSQATTRIDLIKVVVLLGINRMHLDERSI